MFLSFIYFVLWGEPFRCKIMEAIMLWLNSEPWRGRGEPGRSNRHLAPPNLFPPQVPVKTLKACLFRKKFQDQHLRLVLDALGNSGVKSWKNNHRFQMSLSMQHRLYQLPLVGTIYHVKGSVVVPHQVKIVLPNLEEKVKHLHHHWKACRIYKVEYLTSCIQKQTYNISQESI